MHRTEAAAARLADQIQDAVHPIDGVHQIVWIARQHIVGTSFSFATHRGSGFGEDIILTGKVNETNPARHL